MEQALYCKIHKIRRGGLMNTKILKKHIDNFLKKYNNNPQEFHDDLKERKDFLIYYQSFSKEKILQMNKEKIYEYLSKLWAMLIWGNKHYVIDKIIENNGLDKFRKSLAELVWGSNDIIDRWNHFRTEIKGMGPAMISEILCKTHPNVYMLWSRRVFIGLNYLEVENLPRYDYQLTGKVYSYLCDVSKNIASFLKESGYDQFEDATLLAVDYFIWHELQVEDNLSKIFSKQKEEPKKKTELEFPEQQEFIHDDIRDKISDIGLWLGFQPRIEQNVSDGSRVDTIWEATIGNMGRVIYVFEVQTKGSIDSLILNLLKSLNNPAVQGVVAVSDKDQLERIKKHAADVKDLRDKLKYWDYEEVSKVHESLEYINSVINNLNLVPQSF